MSSFSNLGSSYIITTRSAPMTRSKPKLCQLSSTTCRVRFLSVQLGHSTSYFRRALTLLIILLTILSKAWPRALPSELCLHDQHTCMFQSLISHPLENAPKVHSNIQYPSSRLHQHIRPVHNPFNPWRRFHPPLMGLSCNSSTSAIPHSHPRSSFTRASQCHKTLHTGIKHTTARPADRAESP